MDAHDLTLLGTYLKRKLSAGEVIDPDVSRIKALLADPVIGKTEPVQCTDDELAEATQMLVDSAGLDADLVKARTLAQTGAMSSLDVTTLAPLVGAWLVLQAAICFEMHNDGTWTFSYKKKELSVDAIVKLIGPLRHYLGL